MKPTTPRRLLQCVLPIPLTLSGIISGCGMSSNAGMGLDYGTGGLQMGPNRGGWGEGYGETFKSPDGGIFKQTQDHDPHYASDYQSGKINTQEGYPYYHPNRSSASPNTEAVDPSQGPRL